jgi:hypothetical protein
VREVGAGVDILLLSSLVSTVALRIEIEELRACVEIESTQKELAEMESAGLICGPIRIQG